MSTSISPTLLADQIKAFTDSMSKAAPPEVLALLHSELTRMAESGMVENALKAGQTAPDFTLLEARGQRVRLSALLAKGPVVVTFYRGGWCPFCNLQLRAYQSVLPEIHGLGAELVAISPQKPDYALTDAEQKELTFPVLSDRHNTVARAYGLVYTLSEALQRLQEGFGNPLPKFNGEASWELPMPGTFVLAPDGIVRLAHVDVNYMNRLEPSVLLDALRL
jgi:peroxiredoxin